MTRIVTILRTAVAAALLLGLVGCNRPGAPAGAPAGPQAWIDAPLHESTHPVSPVEIVMHAADPAGVAAIELSINGQVISSLKPEQADAPLVTLRTDWVPTTPGEYVLVARAQNHAGAWSPQSFSRITLTGPAAALLVTPVVPPTATDAFTPEPRLELTPTPTLACSDKATFVADVTIPDNTNQSPGASFTKTWRLHNDGSCAWDETYKVVFVSGEPMGNPTPVSIPAAVAPGSTVDISLPLSAPVAAGTYKGNYQIRNPQGVLFGVGASGQTPFYVQIVVGRPAGPTPTAPERSLPDTQSPSVSISHSPAGDSRPTGSSLTFTATASDNVGVTRIEIWVTAPGQFPVKARTCANATTCSFTGGPYSSPGNLSYFAVAADAAGHETNSGAHTVVLFVVVS